MSSDLPQGHPLDVQASVRKSSHDRGGRGNEDETPAAEDQQVLEPLAGWTVGVTGDRRAAEQVALLERRGATVVCGPVIRTLPLGPEAGLQAATSDLLARPPDVVVATTAIGMRSWFASAWTWGLGERLSQCLAGAQIVARGPKAAAAVAGEGLEVTWKPIGETLQDVLDYLLARPTMGLRIAVQLAGRPQPWFAAALRAAGAEVVELAVYSWILPPDPDPASRLVDALLAGELDAVTLTTSHALTNLLDIAGPRREDVRTTLAAGAVAVSCVGPVTADAAHRAGIHPAVVARPARLGVMVKALADHFASRAHHVQLAGLPATIQGASIAVAGTEVRLNRRERLLLEALLDASGAVLSKSRLADSVWNGDVDEHAVEVAVNRLRRKLGPAAPAVETTNRRGYRLLTGPTSTRRPA